MVRKKFKADPCGSHADSRIGYVTIGRQDRFMDFDGSVFTGTEIRDADMKYSSFDECVFRQVKIHNCDFPNVYFTNSAFYDSRLTSVCLKACELEGVRFFNCHLDDVDLRKTFLKGCDMCGSYLRNIDLTDAIYDVMSMLRCQWRNASKETVLELMRLDCTMIIDGEKKFEDWVKYGQCPFDGQLNRGLLFKESRKLWKPGPPRPLIEIWDMVCYDHNIIW